MSYEYKYICIEEILPKQYIEYWKLLWSKQKHTHHEGGEKADPNPKIIVQIDANNRADR